MGISFDSATGHARIEFIQTMADESRSRSRQMRNEHLNGRIADPFGEVVLLGHKTYRGPVWRWKNRLWITYQDSPVEVVSTPVPCLYKELGQ